MVWLFCFITIRICKLNASIGTINTRNCKINARNCKINARNCKINASQNRDWFISPFEYHTISKSVNRVVKQGLSLSRFMCHSVDNNSLPILMLPRPNLALAWSKACINTNDFSDGSCSHKSRCTPVLALSMPDNSMPHFLYLNPGLYICSNTRKAAWCKSRVSELAIGRVVYRWL